MYSVRSLSGKAGDVTRQTLGWCLSFIVKLFQRTVCLCDLVLACRGALDSVCVRVHVQPLMYPVESPLNKCAPSSGSVNELCGVSGSCAQCLKETKLRIKNILYVLCVSFCCAFPMAPISRRPSAGAVCGEQLIILPVLSASELRRSGEAAGTLHMRAAGSSWRTRRYRAPAACVSAANELFLSTITCSHSDRAKQICLTRDQALCIHL